MQVEKEMEISNTRQCIARCHRLGNRRILVPLDNYAFLHLVLHQHSFQFEDRKDSSISRFRKQGILTEAIDCFF